MIIELIKEYIKEGYDEIEAAHYAIKELCECREEQIEEIEERQHQSGFYAFQDMIEMYRNER